MLEKNLPDLNVIIPVYNAEQYISQTLDSVVSQPYPKLHIICVDDGSLDDSVSIIQEYAQKHDNIHLIRQQNAGVSIARNTGIEYILENGQGYIAFLDADDCWAKDVISEEIVTSFRKVDCIAFASVRASEDLSRICPPNTIKEGIRPGGTVALQSYNNFHFGAILYSVSMLRQYNVRFLAGIKYSEDSLFRFTCLYLADNIQLINRVLYIYRNNPVSAMSSRQYGTDYLPMIIEGYLRTERFLKPHESLERGKLDFFRVMSGIYAMQMTDEHYQAFRCRKALEVFLQQNPHLIELIAQLKEEDLSAEHKELWNLYLNHPVKFRCKSYRKGITRKVYDILLRNALFNKMITNKKYPQMNCYL